MLSSFTSYKLNLNKKPITAIASLKKNPVRRVTFVFANEQEIQSEAKKHKEKSSVNAVRFYDLETERAFAFVNDELIVVADDKARRATDAFIKVLAVIALKRRRTLIKALMPFYDKYLLEAKDFIKKHKVKADVFNNMASKTSVLRGDAKETEDGTKLSERVGEFLKSFRSLYRNSIKADMDSISRSQYHIINALLTLLSSPNSENAYKAVSKYITYLKDSNLTPFFTFTDEDTGGSGKDLMSERRAMLKKLGGDVEKGLSAETREIAKKKNPELLKAYNKLNSNLANRFKHDVRKIVMDTKEPWVFLEKIIPSLKKMGWSQGYLERMYSKTLLDTKKYIGINTSSELTDKFGNSIGVHAVPPGVETLKINPNYGEEGARAAFVYQTQSKKQVAEGKGESAKTYTKNRTAHVKTENKWQPVQSLIKDISSVKLKWRKAVQLKDTKHGMFSLIVEALFWTAGRVGARVGTSEGKTTFGISSLLNKHVISATPQKAKIVYLAKAGQKQTHVLDITQVKNASDADKKALKNLLAYIAERKANSTKDSLLFPIPNAGRVNTHELMLWMRKITGISKFKNHMIRYLRGTEIAVKELEEAKKKALALKKKNKLNQKEADKLFKEAITPVANSLGHFLNEKPNINTSIKSYIQPELMTSWYKEVGMRAPKNVEDAFDSMTKVG